jgi:hypothetical protein
VNGRRPASPAPPRGIVLALALAISALAACGTGASNPPTFPPVGTTPAPAGDATAAARAEVTRLLAIEGLQVTDATSAFRPPEGAMFAGTPRTVIQVTLPDDPTHGYIVLYAFPTRAAALAGANDQAAYIASGPGRAYFVIDTRFTLRVLGGTAIFFSWSPDNSPDARTPSIDLALAQVGTAVPVPA